MKHFRLDMSDARRRTRRNPKREREDAAELGFYTYGVLEIVPLKDIIHTEVWQPGRYERATEAVLNDIPLPAIQVDKQGSKFSIADGIHRYNASRDAGMTHIPVIYSVLVEAPELYKPPEPEKRPLEPGAWVKLRNPGQHRAAPWAKVEERLTFRIQKEVRRYVYSLIGIVRGEPDFLGDFVDTDFDPIDHPPPGAEAIVGRWFTARSRVASRFLGVPTR